MGTTLTGTTPQDTYDSLIKVTDNGPLSGTAKYLSDGLGNDSKLALATTGVGIGTTSPVTIFTAEDTNANVAVINVIGTSPNYIFDVRDDGTSVFRVAGSGKVGIGTALPQTALHIAEGTSGVLLGEVASKPTIIGTSADGIASQELFLKGFPLTFTGNGGGGSEQMRLTNDAYLRMASGTGGIQFNGDTAAANALDDYEEGTFTASLLGTTTNPSTAVTTTGYYTKIGNRVSIEVNFIAVNTTGASGQVEVSGLPFTSNTNSMGVGQVALFYFDFNGAAYVSAFLTGNSTKFELLGFRDDNTWVNALHNAGANRYLTANITYFV
jgi:hypothetical protein